MKKILIIQTAYIGDVILATSLVDQVKKQFPNSQIDFLLRKGNESLLTNHENIKNIYIWDKKSKYKSMFTILKKIRSERYDLCLNIQRFFNAGLFTLLSKAKTKVIFDKNPLSFLISNKVKHSIPHYIEDNFYHEVQRNLQLLQKISEFKIEKDATKYPLSLNTSNSQEKIQAIIKDKSDYLVMAPSSVWFTKQFSKEKWIELKNELNSIHIFFIGAPTDKGYIDTIIQNDSHCSNLAGSLSLIDSAELMKHAKRVLVNDSAPLHLASSVQAKTTAIFCSTVPEFGYGPLSKESEIIQAKADLSCRPCGLHGKKECPKGHFDCSNSISVQEILDTI